MGLMELPQAACLDFNLADGSHGLSRVFEWSGKLVSTDDAKNREFLSDLEEDLSF